MSFLFSKWLSDEHEGMEKTLDTILLRPFNKEQFMKDIRKENGIKTVIPPDREVVQKKRMDEALEKVQGELIRRGKPFSERLHGLLYNVTRLKLKEIGKDSGATDRTLIHWMQFGSRDISKLASLCKTLDVDANFLLGLNDTKRTLAEASRTINECQHCQCTELLCGEGGVGCMSERSRE